MRISASGMKARDHTAGIAANALVHRLADLELDREQEQRRERELHPQQHCDERKERGADLVQRTEARGGPARCDTEVDDEPDEEQRDPGREPALETEDAA